MFFADLLVTARIQKSSQIVFWKFCNQPVNHIDQPNYPTKVHLLNSNVPKAPKVSSVITIDVEQHTIIH